jgi:hypothetical protein
MRADKIVNRVRNLKLVTTIAEKCTTPLEMTRKLYTGCLCWNLRPNRVVKVNATLQLNPTGWLGHQDCYALPTTN